jgi:hypothetical protein
MNTDTRHHVHALIDQLPPTQLAALETILQSMVDPLARKLALAPTDDEPFTGKPGDSISVHQFPEVSMETAPCPTELKLPLGL